MNIKTQLKKFGLSKKQVSIYLELLKSNSLTALQLARETQINRSSVYRNIEKLINNGLVEELEEDTTTRYIARSPDNLEVLANEKLSEAEQLVTNSKVLSNELEMLRASTTSPSQVKFFRGKKGMKQALWNTLSCRKKEVDGFGYLNWYEILGKKYSDLLTKEKLDRGITSRELTNTPEDGTIWTPFEEYARNNYEGRYISPKVLEITHDTYMFDDRILFIHFTNDDYFGFEVKNTTIVELQKQMFEYFWEMGEKMEPFEKFEVENLNI